MSTYRAGDQTKEKILIAAGELAGEKGLDNVSMRAIAKHAGENIGSLHYHFGSKDHLMEELIRYICSHYDLSPFYRILEDFDQYVSSYQGESKLVTEFMHLLFKIHFVTDLPSWHHTIIYSILHTQGRLQEIFQGIFIDPQEKCFFKIAKYLQPEWSHAKMTGVHIVLVSPIVIHSDYQNYILGKLHLKEYSKNYLEKLEEHLIGHAHMLLGLELNNGCVVEL